MVELTGLEKSYGENSVFNGLDLRIDKETELPLLELMSRKSTLVRILAGVEPFQKANEI